MTIDPAGVIIFLLSLAITGIAVCHLPLRSAAIATVAAAVATGAAGIATLIALIAVLD